MRKLILLFLSFFTTVTVQAIENYTYFSDAQAVAGPTGVIDTPSALVIGPGKWSFGLHRFIVGVTYGILPNFEAGINSDLKEMSPLFPLDNENLARKGKEISFHSKYRLLRDGEHPFDVSIGQHRGKFYLLAGKYLERVLDTTLSGGAAWDDGALTTFYSLTQTGDAYQFMIDYDQASDRCNAGCRFLVSPEMKLDFIFLDVMRMKNMFFDNFMFGITVAG